MRSRSGLLVVDNYFKNVSKIIYGYLQINVKYVYLKATSDKDCILVFFEY